MRNNLLEKITKVSFISLATLPLLKENFNSILIFLCAFLVLINVVKDKNKPSLNKDFWIFTSLFWLFLFHEIFSLDLNLGRILLHIPFLIFPLLFLYKPNYINQKIKDISLKVFQLSTLLQCIIYSSFFLFNNQLSNLFYVRNNIPFFREHVSENFFFEIHPTYFSSYLLVSFTISLFSLFTKKDKIWVFHLFNIIVTAFFIFLFSSRIIFILLFLTIVAAAMYIIKKRSTKKAVLIFLSTVILLIILIYPSRNVIGKRFNEIKTEIDKPIVGDYYNSTNTRVAIFKCSVLLIKEAPLFGYGDALQDELNACYKATNKSNFYKKQTFNTHNYYFNLIAYGGWLFLFGFLYYIIFIYKKIKYSILGIFLIMQFLLVNVTENYFSRHFGIVLFTYLTSLFIFIKSEDKKEEC